MGSVNEHIPDRLKFAIESGRYKPFVGANVSIDECVRLGFDCIIKPGTSIGHKGFSFAFTEALIPVPIVHKGGVIIGDHVEIGANCTIARATREGKNTILGDYVKLDDQVHIGHNCIICRRTIITACAELSGGVLVGDSAWLGPNCSIMEHVTIGMQAIIGIGAVVIDDVPAYAIVAGNPARILRYRNL